MDGTERVVLAGRSKVVNPVFVNLETVVAQVHWTNEAGAWSQRDLPRVPSELADRSQRMVGTAAILGPMGSLHAVWLGEVRSPFMEGAADLIGRYVMGYAHGPTTGAEWAEVEQIGSGNDLYFPAITWHDGGPLIVWWSLDGLHVVQRLDGEWDRTVLDIICTDPAFIAGTADPVLICKPTPASNEASAWQLRKTEEGWSAGKLLQRDCEDIEGLHDGIDTWLIVSDCEGEAPLYRINGTGTEKVIEDLFALVPGMHDSPYPGIMAATRDMGGSWHVVFRSAEVAVVTSLVHAPIHAVFSPDWELQRTFRLTDDLAETTQDQYNFAVDTRFLPVGNKLLGFVTIDLAPPRTNLYEATIEVLPLADAPSG